MSWVAAVNQRYKLILSPRDVPWLIDLDRDPDELTNCFADPDYATTVRFLARELLAYGDRYNDGRLDESSIRADLQKAVDEPLKDEIVH